MIKKLPYINTIILFLILVALIVIGGILWASMTGLMTVDDFIRYENHDLNVVCYVLTNLRGISCFPMN